jgi:hypothetical protein
MRIQPIVEGHGELEAVPILLRRLIARAQVFHIDVGKPIRWHRGQLVREGDLRRAVRLARIQEDARSILIVFDADEDCPKDVAPRVLQWAADEASPLPCAVVLPNREYEAWFVASAESLRGKRGIRADAGSHSDPEEPRDSKGALESLMEPYLAYSETADQPALSALFDMGQAYAACRSFRHLVRAFGDLVARMDAPIRQWPPPEWTAGAG